MVSQNGVEEKEEEKKNGIEIKARSYKRTAINMKARIRTKSRTGIRRRRKKNRTRRRKKRRKKRRRKATKVFLLIISFDYPTK